MRILIVDDQRTQSLGLSQLLRQLGYLDLLTAASAEDAYQQLRLHTVDLEPIPCSIDIILMDVNMPDESGIEACASIKSNSAWRDIPIIMVTTSEEIKDLSDAFNAGAMDYIHKPPIKDELNVRVSSALRLKYETDERKKREHDLKVERERSEKLLLNILPAPVAMRLKDGEKVIADQFDEATVLFMDIANFTPLASNMSPDKLVELLNSIFSLFDAIIEKHGLEKIKTMGDAYMAVGGLPIPMPGHAEAVAHAALEILEEFPKLTNNNLQLRIGIHTGPVVAGVIGRNKFIYDLWGDTVNIASRMQSHGRAGSIQVSVETYQSLKDKFEFNPRGEIEIKGKGVMQAFLLNGQKSYFPLEVKNVIPS
jgi:class 3 adenylate cyclase